MDDILLSCDGFNSGRSQHTNSKHNLLFPHELVSAERISTIAEQSGEIIPSQNYRSWGTSGNETNESLGLAVFLDIYIIYTVPRIVTAKRWPNCNWIVMGMCARTLKGP